MVRYRVLFGPFSSVFPGFGRVDAAAAVNMASSWQSVDNETAACGLKVEVNERIDHVGTAVTSTYTVSQSGKAEHVEVIFNQTEGLAGM